LREFTRSGLDCPYSAPQTLSASADSSELITVPSRLRIRSGDASDRAWPNMRAGSIMEGAVIAAGAASSVVMLITLPSRPGSRVGLRYRSAGPENEYGCPRRIPVNSWLTVLLWDWGHF